MDFTECGREFSKKIGEKSAECCCMVFGCVCALFIGVAVWLVTGADVSSSFQIAMAQQLGRRMADHVANVVVVATTICVVLAIVVILWMMKGVLERRAVRAKPKLKR